MSYSTDGNQSWVAIPQQISGAGAVQVTASGLGEGDNIYAGTDASEWVYRWTIGQTPTDPWVMINSIPYPGYGISGICLKEGILYAIGSDGADSKTWWTPNPTITIPEWYNIYNPCCDPLTFNLPPQALKEGSGRIWAIDTTGHKLFSRNTVIYGDVNEDGVVDALDLFAEVRFILGWEFTLTPEADANQDGNVNILDLVEIKRTILGLDY